MLSSVLWMRDMINAVSANCMMPTCIQPWADTAWNLYFLYVEHCHVHGIWSVLSVVLYKEKNSVVSADGLVQKRICHCVDSARNLYFICTLTFCFVHWIWSVLGLLMVGCINVCNHLQTQHRIFFCMLNFAWQRKCLIENNLMIKLYIRIFHGAFI